MNRRTATLIPQSGAGAEQTTAAHRAYGGSRFSEVRDAIFANPYQRVEDREGEPAPRVYAVTLGGVLRGILPFGTLHPNGVCLTDQGSTTGTALRQRRTFQNWRTTWYEYLVIVNYPPGVLSNVIFWLGVPRRYDVPLTWPERVIMFSITWLIGICLVVPPRRHGRDVLAEDSEGVARARRNKSRGVCIVKCVTKVVLILLSLAAMPAGAQSPANDRSVKQETQARGYWNDPATGLMWAGKDNGRDLNWQDAVKYCRDLRLAGYADWRLPTLAELEGIYDRSANAPGFAGPGKGRAYTWHVKGNLFLTGVEWSTSQRMDDRGHPNGLAWYFDFNNGTQNDDDTGRFSGRFANYGRRALCVRGSGK